MVIQGILLGNESAGPSGGILAFGTTGLILDAGDEEDEADSCDTGSARS